QPGEEYGANLTMGMTAENLPERDGISREEQDEFSDRSQELAQYAIEKGLIKKEIIPYDVSTRKETKIFDTDEHPRKTSIEKLLTLRPVFKEGGTVTAGNSSGRNDGASVLLLASEEHAKINGYKPKARVIAQA